MSIKTYNLFISHSWTYSNAYNNLTSMLDEAKYFDCCRGCPVPACQRVP